MSGADGRTSVAETLASNAMLTAVGRVMLAVGGPIAAAGAAWAGAMLISLSSDLTTLKAQWPDMVRRVEKLEDRATKGASSDTDVATTLAGVKETVRGHDARIERVERAVDQWKHTATDGVSGSLTGTN